MSMLILPPPSIMEIVNKKKKKIIYIIININYNIILGQTCVICYNHVIHFEYHLVYSMISLWQTKMQYILYLLYFNFIMLKNF